jgi:hypothetical protein
LEITVPTGSFLLIRMSETLDTSTAQPSQLFTATLVTNLAAQGYVVARQGTTVYGQVVDVSSARRFFGKSKITLQLTQIVINGTAIGITTDTWDSEGKSSGARTARRTLGGAGLGAGIFMSIQTRRVYWFSAMLATPANAPCVLVGEGAEGPNGFGVDGGSVPGSPHSS